MAHEITENDGVVTRQTPWHGLGVTLGRGFTATEALEYAKLGGWDVEIVPTYHLMPVHAGGGMSEVPDKYVIRRGDNGKYLGVVGDRYEPIQNEELFEFAEALIDTGEAHFESAGSLRDNRLVFLSMKVERPVTVADVEFEPILTCASSHDGSLSALALVSPVVVVCMNTLSLAIADATYQYKIRHTANYADRLAEARLALRITFEYLDGFEDEVRKLIDTELTKKQFGELLADVFPSDTASELKSTRAENKREQVRAVYATDPSARPWIGSAWGALNALNTWELWESGIKVTGKVSQNRQVARLERHGEGFLRDNQTPVTKKAHKLLVEARTS